MQLNSGLPKVINLTIALELPFFKLSEVNWLFSHNTLNILGFCDMSKLVN